MDDATLSQVIAARPDASTWLSANAGSGKTKVLTDRVARLLLRGTPPQSILCLTYTKAAASEMQNRLFDRLGAWAMLPDAPLMEQLRVLGETGLESGADDSLLPRARRLFARAIETPGGLKIQTIHAFCASLLRRFPLEARVAPDFTEADERSLSLLKREVLDTLCAGPQAAVVQRLMQHCSEQDFSALIDEIGKHRDVFSQDTPDWDAVFDLPRGFDERALHDAVFLGGEGDLLRRLITVLGQGSPNDVKLAAKLAKLGEPTLTSLAALEAALLTSANATAPFTAKKVGTNATRKTMGDALIAQADGFAQRVEAARPLRLNLAAAQGARALHGFARLWLPAFDLAKARRRWLDFDDLIRLARHLLENPSVAQWVLFKLDGGIDHILIDEAQDTSPGQWRVIQHLTEEFTAGQGARDDARTIFVVGDRKQSIYSFQGADLQGFERMRTDFSQRLNDAGEALHQRQLVHSFRSSPAILRFVDQVFAPGTEGQEQGETGLGAAPEHLAFHTAMPGRVDLWPAVPKPEKADESPWYDPLDRVDQHDPRQVLARALAQEIRRMIDTGTQLLDKGAPRPVHEGDFLVLVRTRSPLFSAIIRACKEQGLAIAGADRLVLTQELAVQDVIALLRFLALPDDDLSLAIALRSPLFGWSEDRLFQAAYGRKGQRLWQVLRNDPSAMAERAVLLDLLGQVDFLRPYELIERVLTRHHGRARILARLGEEVSEAIEAFVDLALTYETGDVPTLDGFLAWLVASDAEIKRQAESAGRRLRVMTVHGAKGLEAPIVILPDTAKWNAQDHDRMIVAQQTPLLRASQESASAVQLARDAERKTAREQERDRLLYVALTRAESWLILAGAGDCAADDTWFQQAHRAMVALPVVDHETPTGRGLRYEHGVWPHDAAAQHRPPVEPAGLPVLADLPPLQRAPRPLTPTALGGAKAMPGEGEAPEIAMARGSYIHALIEAGLAGLDLDSVPMPGLDPSLGEDTRAKLRAQAMAEVRTLLADPRVQSELSPPGAECLTEVAVSGTLADRPLWGVIDRLTIGATGVTILDFKSNRVVPQTASEIPDGITRQLSAYQLMVQPLFPFKPVVCAVVWTATAQVMPVPDAQLSNALAAATLDLS